MQEHLTPPEDLVKAVKHGKKFARRRADTNATHIRRFSKAFAVYACAALVLIGGSLTLPALLSDSPAPAPLAQPSVSTDTQKPYFPIDYIRPDLIWANEHNPERKNTVIWSAENIDGKSIVTNELTLPDIGGEDAEYAIEFRGEFVSNETKNATPAYIIRRMAHIDAALLNLGFEAVDIEPAEDGSQGRSVIYAASRKELSAIDTDELLSAVASADGNLRFKLRIAWQSLDGSQIPDDDLFIEYLNLSSSDLSAYALDRYVYTDKEGYVRPDLIWANELNPVCTPALFSATRLRSTTTYSVLHNTDDVTDYTFAVDIQLQIIPEGKEKGEAALIKGFEEAQMVEMVLGWKPIVAGESYEATCEQLMALNDADIVPAFAEAYEALYGIDADSIPTISVLVSIAWQSCQS